MKTHLLQPLAIDALDFNMLAMLTIPCTAKPEPSIGVVIVNGGAQYRVGAHRLFVKLAEHLASQGIVVLRFDLPGQGDSPGQPVGFQQSASHIGAAVGALLQEQPGLQQVVLLGLCDGASASLLYLEETEDPRIGGLILLNPWVHTETSSVRTRVKHYYRQRLLMPDFWKKVLAGGIGLDSLRELSHALIRSISREHKDVGTFQARMGKAWKRFPGFILLLISDKDLTGQEFVQYTMETAGWEGALQHPNLAHYVLQQADHTFSPAAASRDLNALIALWIQKTLNR